ncbi:ankyrin, partial [Piromyces finnis]
FEHSTFDYSYLDDYGNSLLNHCIIKNEDEVCYFLKYMNDEIVSQINNKKEASLIIASKFGKSQIIENLLTYPYIRKNINHTDCHGNTALFYAVQLRDKETIELLLKHGDNPYIPNNEGNT